ncbi:MAG: transposase [Acidobacteriaceae bacterium]
MLFTRRDLPHIQRDTRALFVTFMLKAGRTLTPQMRDIVLDHCLHDHGKRYDLHAAVIMSTHVHLLFSPRLAESGEVYLLSKIMQGIKGSSSRSINKLMRNAGPVWRDESFDHVVRSDADFENHFIYIFENAFSVSGSGNPYDYPWLWTPGER